MLGDGFAASAVAHILKVRRPRNAYILTMSCTAFLKFICTEFEGCQKRNNDMPVGNLMFSSNLHSFLFHCSLALSRCQYTNATSCCREELRKFSHQLHTLFARVCRIAPSFPIMNSHSTYVNGNSKMPNATYPNHLQALCIEMIETL